MDANRLHVSRAQAAFCVVGVALAAARQEARVIEECDEELHQALMDFESAYMRTTKALRKLERAK